MFLYFYVWFDYSYGRSRPLTLRCSANTAKTHKWSLLLQGSCSHHCFFSELWRSRVNRFGPLTISTLPDFCQMGWFTDQGNPFFVEKPEEPRVTFFLVFKEVRTEEFAKTLKVCFLWLFVLTAVCCSKLEFWVQEVILMFVGFAVSILSPLILEGPTGPWQQTHSKHDDAFPVFLVNNCYHKDAAWFPLKKSSLKTDWIFNYSRGNYGLLRYLGSKQLGHHQNLKIWPLWHWNLRRSPCVACWLGRPVIFNDFKTRDFWNDHPRIDIFRYLGTGELVWNSMKFTLQRVVYKKPWRFRGEFQAKRVSLCRC